MCEAQNAYQDTESFQTCLEKEHRSRQDVCIFLVVTVLLSPSLLSQWWILPSLCSTCEGGGYSQCQPGPKSPHSQVPGPGGNEKITKQEEKKMKGLFISPSNQLCHLLPVKKGVSIFKFWGCCKRCVCISVFAYIYYLVQLPVHSGLLVTGSGCFEPLECRGTSETVLEVVVLLLFQKTLKPSTLCCCSHQTLKIQRPILLKKPSIQLNN